MSFTCTSLLFSFFLFFISGAMASPTSLGYQGRILKSDGTPLEYKNVSFIFQIMDPTGLCLIYQEQVDGINMVNSHGIFDVPIGGGAVTYPTSGSFTIADAFNNSSTFPCYGGSSYGASVGDVRKLRVQFYDGKGWNTISPDTTVRSVPYAHYSYSAAKLGNNVASDFVLKSLVPGCPAGTFLTYSGGASGSFTCKAVSGASGGTVTDVTSTNPYLSVVNGSSTPALTVNVGTTSGTVAAGDDSRIVNALQSGATAGGDLTGTLPNPTVARLRGVPVHTVAPTSGQYLKFDGSKWLGSGIDVSDVNNLGAQLSGLVSQAAFNGYVASASCSPSQTMYWNSASGGFSCQPISVSAVTSITAGAGLTGGTISSTGTIGLGTELTGVNSLATTGYIQRTGPGTYSTTLASASNSNSTLVQRDGAGAASFSSVVLNNSTMNVTQTAPAAGTPYAVTWPSAAPSSNNMTLVSTTGGAMSWSSVLTPTLNAGQIFVGNASNVATGVSMSGDATMAVSGALTLANTSVAPASYGSATQVATFTVDSKGRLTTAGNVTISGVAPGGTAGGDLSGSYPNPGVAKLSGTSLAIASLSSGQVLKYSGGSWVNATDADTLGGLACASGDVAYYTGGVWACRNSSTTNSNNSLIQRDGTGAFSSASANLGSVQINNGAGGTATLSVPGAFTSYTLRLPASAGNAGQVMSSNGSGDMVWSSAVTVSGSQVVGTAKSNSTGVTTIDFVDGNLQYTSDSCGSFNLWNMKSGASYTFAVQGTTAATCSFAAFSDGGGTSLTMHLPPDHGPTTSGTHTVYTFVVLGSHVYASWITGY